MGKSIDNKGVKEKIGLKFNKVLKIPRKEYPRPDFVRPEWMNLNGEWEFEFDDNDFGLKENWINKKFSRKIIVPFPFQSRLSGIGDTNFHNIVWYARDFNIPIEWIKKDRKLLLNFGAVDYESKVWINGEEVGVNKGGHVPFTFDITEYVKKGKNRLVLRVVDTQSKEQPRGKQHFELKSRGCFYTRTTGIWQTVWLEPVSISRIDSIKITPDIDNAVIKLESNVIEANSSQILEVSIGFDSEIILKKRFEINGGSLNINIKLPILYLWSPETPNLYSLNLILKEKNKIIDEVDSYFGMRKISVKGDRILLNNKPYFQRLVLDQGYFPDGILSAPTDFDLKNDIILSKKAGFNGCRKHQKVEDPRFLYWADKLGYLVWGEMANAFEWSEAAEEMFISEWQRVIKRDYNHPCIIVWSPFNESWGIPNVYDNPRIQSYVRRVVALTREMDRTRLINDNDGWEHVDTDIVTIHDYALSSKEYFKRYKKFMLGKSDLPKAHRFPFIKGKKYEGQPVLITEYGGIGYKSKNVLDKTGWGYHGAVTKQNEFLKRLKDVTSALYKMKFICGFCYTQLTDVEQEINGIFTYARKPKVNVEKIRNIIEDRDFR